jgi:hypothetical protein
MEQETAEKCMTTSFIACDQIKRIRQTCSTHGKDEKCIQNYGPKGKKPLEDLGVGSLHLK